MNIDRKVVEQALEALKQIDEAMPFPVAKLAQAALREALANSALDRMAENARELGLDYDAPVVTSDTSQERVDGTANQRHVIDCPRCGHCCQQRELVGLTDEEIIGIGNASSLKAKLTSTGIIIHPDGIKNFAQAIKAKLKEKNT
jgi:hypothetical protein